MGARADKIIVIDFGGQYCHLISRRIRDMKVVSEILQPDTGLDKLRDAKGIILSGGAASVYDGSAPKCDRGILQLGIPVLGICYGHQLIAFLDSGKVVQGEAGEYGMTKLRTKKSALLSGIKLGNVWMNHRDIVEELPDGYEATASTKSSPVAAFENKRKKIYGLQFHPEVVHTVNGSRILENFVFGVCRAKKSLSTENLIESIIAEAKRIIGGRKAIIALSGGVDSTTSAVLVGKAIGERLTAVYVDTGLMRYGETESIKKAVSKHGMKFRVADAKERFFSALKGIEDPEQKRKIIGKLFIEIFEEEARKEKASVLVQGTIYSDRIESGVTKHSSVIKSHHNVGGLPEKMNLELYEPLKDLYKDEVRQIAKSLSLPGDIVNRQVFPGPGLAIRIIGEVTPEKAEIVRKASRIVEEGLGKEKFNYRVWMAFAVLLPVKTVGIQGDERSYKYPVVVRIVESKDAMTANFFKVPYSVLERISTRITNEIREVNRVVYDITNKPPASMEWE